MSLSVDLNADLGEGAGHDDELLALVSSANIACGLHAGNVATMQRAMHAAAARGVAIGAHPGFEDRENFGRREIAIGDEEVFALVVYQLGAFRAVAQALGVRVEHVKPHGALYNMAAREEAIADAIARAVRAVDAHLLIYAPAASALSRAAEANELTVVREVFADRNYLADGSLVPREHPEALLHDAVEAANRVFGMLRDDKVRAIDGTEVPVHVDTVCVHGDTPDAVAFAMELRVCLAQTGVTIGPPRPLA